MAFPDMLLFEKRKVSVDLVFEYHAAIDSMIEPIREDHLGHCDSQLMLPLGDLAFRAITA